jgi:hypothetical protein
MRRTVDGDMGILKLSRALVQAIEGDRIRTPSGGLPVDYSAADFTHGVRTDEDHPLAPMMFGLMRLWAVGSDGASVALTVESSTGNTGSDSRAFVRPL